MKSFVITSLAKGMKYLIVEKILAKRPSKHNIGGLMCFRSKKL